MSARASVQLAKACISCMKPSDRCIGLGSRVVLTQLHPLASGFVESQRREESEHVSVLDEWLHGPRSYLGHREQGWNWPVFASSSCLGNPMM